MANATKIQRLNIVDQVVRFAIEVEWWGDDEIAAALRLEWNDPDLHWRRNLIREEAQRRGIA